MSKHNHGADDYCSPSCPHFECVEGCGCAADPLVKKMREEERKRHKEQKQANDLIFLLTVLGSGS